MPAVVEVRFKGNRKDFFTLEAPESSPTVGDSVVVEVERGQDLGLVSAVGEAAQKKCGVGCSGCAIAKPKDPVGRVVRVASSEDTTRASQLRGTEDEARRKALDRVRAHGLDMKVTDAEWQWDRKKLTIYFTAEARVDFRALVRDLAGLFRTRIDLRQIGARDEAKRLDGVGRCGRQFCCSSWLPELRPVSLALAKDQHLSLNPSQISGGCGRLLCCLRYEHDFYVASRKRFPKEGKTLRTARGVERVQAIDIFRERVMLQAEDGTTRSLALAQLKDEIAAPAGLPPSPAPEPEAPQPPSSLVTFDEGSAAVTPEQAAEAVAPSPRRSRRRRRRRGGGGGGGRGTGGPRDAPNGHRSPLPPSSPPEPGDSGG